MLPRIVLAELADVADEEDDDEEVEEEDVVVGLLDELDDSDGLTSR